MFITSVKLTNFGIHKSLEFRPREQPIVGLLGPNGGGKTTVLKGVEFLFTGGLEDNAASYIRTGEKRAELEAEFIKHGHHGRIYRRITATTSQRELTWQGQTHTKAAEVDAVLAEILGADKQAVSNAVFLSQGSLDKILFGDQSEREKLFTRLVNISHLEKVKRILDTKIAALAGGLEDLSVLRDEINASLAAAEEAIRTRDLELRSWQDHSHRVAWLQPRLQLGRAVHALTGSLEQTGSRHALISGQLRTLLGTHQAESVEVLEKRAEEARITVDGIRLKLHDVEQGIHRRRAHEQATATARQIEERLTTTRGRIETLRPLAAADLAGVRAMIEREHARQRSLASGQELARQVQATTQALQQVTAEPSVDEGVLTTLAGEIDEKQLALKGVDLSIKTLSAVLEARLAATDQACKCPTCEQQVDASLIRPERLDALKALQQSFRQQLSAVTERRDELVRRKEQRDARYKQLAGDLSRLLQQQAQWRTTFTTFPPEADLAALENQRQQIESAITELRGLRQVEADDQRQLTALQVQIEQDKAVDFSAFTEARRVVLVDSLTGADQAWQRAQQAWFSVKPLLADVQKMTGEIDGLRRQLASATAELTAHEGRRPADVVVPDHGLEAAFETERQHEQTRQQMIGQLAQAREQAAGLRRRRDDLQRREDVSKARRRAVDDLRQVAEVLDRGGLPMAYVTYRFQQLVELTRRNLSLLEANFTVSLDPEKVVSFRFVRLDDPAAVELPQSKLSGGQRVRLAVAFLLSVQQLLMPELGLLVLDEPSTHLDLEGVESLKELLLNMSQTLQNAQHQVWLVDHHPAIEPALGACLRVGKHNN